MKHKSMWAILIVTGLLVSIAIVSFPAAACFTQYTKCDGREVRQGDGGGTDYWYNHLYPDKRDVDPGLSVEWIINIRGGGGCSGYEHATISDNDPPSGWVTEIEMGDINTGSFTYIDNGMPVTKGDDIEDREFKIGRSWNFDVIYRITAPGGASGGEFANMTCTVYVVGYSPENQHDYVYVHCEAVVVATNQPIILVMDPNGDRTCSSMTIIMWDVLFAIVPFDQLYFDIYLSSDGGVTYPDTLATGLNFPMPPFELPWDTTAHPDDINYRIMIEAFDGTNYGHDISDSNFAIDNYGPDPPTELKIHFGLVSDAEPTAKASGDNTGSPLERLAKDDSRGYIVPKQMTLEMETFNVTTQNEPVESAELYVEYWVENTGYSGISSVMWKLESEGTFHNTDITPQSSEMSPVLKTYDLYAQGVDTIDKIMNLDIMFWNTDGGEAQNVSFDYIWVKFKASSNDLGLTWEPATAPDFSHYRIYRSPDNSAFTQVGETHATAWNDDGDRGVDLSNYFYKVHAVDLGDHEGPPTYTVGKMVSPISGGWNMVSLPLEQLGGGSIDASLKSIEGNYISLQTYHAGYSRPWLHWHESKPGMLNTLTSMDHKSGYYVDVGSSGHLKTIGKVIAGESIPLKTGWNLIGFPSLISVDRDTALTSIAGLYDAVYGFDATAGKEKPILGTDMMDPGSSYWIHVTEDCVLGF
ncbi:MAG: hypothetical protein JSW00_09290 [Thermoplasmata archaeon]|nr:MAG: hypothetical protein JSW00_09290 [Thermoplasmata archaeon]